MDFQNLFNQNQQNQSQIPQYFKNNQQQVDQIEQLQNILNDKNQLFNLQNFNQDPRQQEEQIRLIQQAKQEEEEKEKERRKNMTRFEKLTPQEQIAEINQEYPNWKEFFINQNWKKVKVFNHEHELLNHKIFSRKYHWACAAEEHFKKCFSNITIYDPKIEDLGWRCDDCFFDICPLCLRLIMAYEKIVRKEKNQDPDLVDEEYTKELERSDINSIGPNHRVQQYQQQNQNLNQVNKEQEENNTYQRLLEEQEKVNAEDNGIEVTNINDDVKRWLVTIQGSKDTVWEGVNLKLNMEFPANFPNSPPKVKFNHQMFHPNVYEDGTVASSIAWQSDIQISVYLIQIQALINTPDEESAVNKNAASLFKSNPDQYLERQRNIALQLKQQVNQQPPQVQQQQQQIIQKPVIIRQRKEAQGDIMDSYKQEYIKNQQKFMEQFGIENQFQNQNCFLNVILQAFWNIFPFRSQLVMYSMTNNNKETLPIDFFAKAFLQFFLDIFNDQQALKNLNEAKTSYSPIPIRKELFKYFYTQNYFNLNENADAAEALNKILQLLHMYIQRQILEYERVEVDVKCNPTECFVHDNFYLKLKMVEKCKCNAIGKSQDMDSNNFTQLVNVSTLLLLAQKRINNQLNNKFDSYDENFDEKLRKFPQMNFNQQIQFITKYKINEENDIDDNEPVVKVYVHSHELIKQDQQRRKAYICDNKDIFPGCPFNKPNVDSTTIEGWKCRYCNYDLCKYCIVMCKSIQDVRNRQQQNIKQIQQQFIQIYKKSIEQYDNKCSKEDCQIKQQYFQYIIPKEVKEYPNVLTFNLNWTEYDIERTQLLNLLLTIPNKFKLQQLFDFEDQQLSENQLPQYEFKGMVCMFESHYICYFRNLKQDVDEYQNLYTEILDEYKFKEQWMLFDDRKVQYIQHWSEIVLQCIEFKYKPTLLFFQKLNQQFQDDKAENQLQLNQQYLLQLLQNANENDNLDQQFYEEFLLQQENQNQDDDQATVRVNKINPNQSQEKKFNQQFAQQLSDFYKKLAQVKVKYQPKDIFLYKCKCHNYINIDQKVCQYCNENNQYYIESDDQKQIDNMIKLDLQKDLQQLNEINPYNQNETKMIENLIQTEIQKVLSNLYLYETGKDKNAFKDTLNTLKTISSNIINNPNDEKTKRLKRANKAVKTKILKYENAQKFLSIIGFDMYSNNEQIFLTSLNKGLIQKACEYLDKFIQAIDKEREDNEEDESNETRKIIRAVQSSIQDQPQKINIEMQISLTYNNEVKNINKTESFSSLQNQIKNLFGNSLPGDYKIQFKNEKNQFVDMKNQLDFNLALKQKQFNFQIISEDKQPMLTEEQIIQTLVQVQQLIHKKLQISDQYKLSQDDINNVFKSIQLDQTNKTHYFVTCDGCGASPIQGNRYKCGECKNFDYCENCYKSKAQEHKHKFNQPIEKCAQQTKMKYLFQEFQQRYEEIVLKKQDEDNKVYSSELVKESFSDYLQVLKKTNFIKEWVFRNNGDTQWDEDIRFIHIRGDNFQANPYVLKSKVEPGQECSIKIKLTSLNQQGKYTSHFTLANRNNKPFGQEVQCSIEVIEENENNDEDQKLEQLLGQLYYNVQQ